MAQIIEEVIAIKLSRMVKKSGDAPALVATELLATIETVVQELVGDTVIVEVSAIDG